MNKAARIQGFAKSDEFLISEEIYETPGVKERIAAESNIGVRLRALDLKGLRGRHNVYALSLGEINKANSDQTQARKGFLSRLLGGAG